MSRLVQKDVGIAPNRMFDLNISAVRAARNVAAPAIAAAANETEVDNYATRMVKYIPAEVVAFFTAADQLFAKAPDAVGGNLAQAFLAKYLYYFSLAVFVIGLIGTPIYLSQQARADEPWKVHAVVATIAYVIWTYALQGAVFAPIYSAAIASFLVLVFTFASGLIKPAV
jgi:hypothetical protein